MGNLLILTDAVTENPEVVEEAFNLGEWLNSNTGITMAICTGVVVLAAVLIALFKRKKR